MSFGVSAGGFIGVPGAANRELGTIHITLRSLGDDAGNPSSLLCRRGVARKDEVLQMVSSLEISLKEVGDPVEKYSISVLALHENEISCNDWDLVTEIPPQILSCLKSQAER